MPVSENCEKLNRAHNWLIAHLAGLLRKSAALYEKDVQSRESSEKRYICGKNGQKEFGSPAEQITSRAEAR